MARSKEQWKAQQRSLHTQATTKSFFQMKRPASGSRPAAPPVNAALFQLGRPALGAPPVSAAPDASGSGGSSAQAIDLTLDDEEEEDEPMGAQQTGNAAIGASSAASAAVKRSLVDGSYNEPQAVAQSLQASDLTVPFAEDVESDVDEDWPEVPQSESVDDQLPRVQTKEAVMAALTTISKSVTGGQMGSDQEQNAQGEATSQQTSTPLLHDNADEMEVEVNEELPNQVKETETDATDSPKTTDRAVPVDHLEDGEIFEEGAPRQPMLQQVMARDSPPIGAMGTRPHQRNKKQKKRGKKKAKRKLEAMQMMHTPAGEMLPEFERLTRQRPFPDAPPPGQYTLAMMRNSTPSGAMNVRPVFQDSTSVPFQPGSVSGGRNPLMRPALPPPLPYGDSQILRVNRQGSMEMFVGDADQSSHMMFAAPSMQGGFKYRTVVSIPPPSRPTRNGPGNLLQRSVSDQSFPLPVAPQSHSDGSNAAPSRERKNSENFDLDSLRAAALRSKVNRSMKTSTSTLKPTTPAVTKMNAPSSLPSSPKSIDKEERNSEPASPEDEDELRLEILRSMKRKRKQTALKSSSNVPVASVNVPSAVEMDVQKKLDDCSKPVDNDREDKAPTQSKKVGVAEAESVVDAGACRGTDYTTLESDKVDARIEAEAPLTSGSESATPSVEQAVANPEFCPLTACSQSLVIRLGPEDFSSREGGDENRPKTTPSRSLQDAIKEMRRQIAEREKEQTSRLLVNAAGRFSQPSESSSSPASSTSPSHVSPGKKVSTLGVQAAGATGTCPEVSSSVTEYTKKPSCAAGAELDNPGKGKPLKQISAIETLPPAATAGPTANPMGTQELGNTSGQDASMLTTTCTDGVRVKTPSVAEEPASEDAVISESDNGSIDFDAVRAEYEQCEAECKEADMQIARLSSEMTALKTQLPPVDSAQA